MARSQADLQALLGGLEGVEKAYFQPSSSLVYPCIVYERGTSNVRFADNVKYWNKKGYTVTVIDRSPDSLIPDLVDGLPYSRFDRFFRTDGLNHFVFQLYF